MSSASHGKSATDAYLDACASHAVRPLDVIATALRGPHTFRVAGLTMSDIAMECMLEGMSHLQELSEVQLMNLKLSPHACKELSHSLGACSALAHLSIVGVNLGNDGLEALMPVLRTLSGLVLQSAEISNMGAATLAEHLAPASSLRQLDLQGNKIKCQGVIALAAAFQVNGGLQVINLRANEVGDSGATALSKALGQNKSITQLYLGENRIGPDGATQLASSQVSGHLRLLDLAANQILSAGAAAIAQMCRRSKTLHQLYLGANDFGDEGFVALGEAFKTSESLATVDLRGEMVGGAGLASIAAALKTNQSIRELLLDVDPSAPNGAAAIANALRSNTTITQLELGACGGDEGVLAAINGTLRVNKFITTIGAAQADGPASPSLSSPSLFSPASKEGLPSVPPPLPPPLPRTPRSPPQRSAHQPVSQSMSHSVSQPTIGTAISAPKPTISPSPPKMSPAGRKVVGSGARGGGGGGRDSMEGVSTAGWNKRLEQLAAAMEVRLQSQEAQMIRLASDLSTEREHKAELQATVEELRVQLDKDKEEREAMKDELAGMREEMGGERALREKLREELRWVDEAGVQARVQEEAARKHADEGVVELLRTQQAEVGRLGEVVGTLEVGNNAAAELHSRIESSLGQLVERSHAFEEAMQAEIERLREELNETRGAAEVSAEASERCREVEGGQKKLQEEARQLRWIDEEHMRCRAEDENKVALMIQAAREDFDALRSQVNEAVAPLGDPGALSALKHTCAKVDALGRAVEGLCALMDGVKEKQVAVAASEHTLEFEEVVRKIRVELAQATKGHESLVLRVDELELALQKEQESSLKALQAILHSHSK